MLEMLTIRQAGKRGPLAEHQLRLMQKQGKLPGVYAGNRYLVNYEMLLARLNQESCANCTNGTREVR